MEARERDPHQVRERRDTVSSIKTVKLSDL